MKPGVFLDTASLDQSDLSWDGLKRALPELIGHESTSPDQILDRSHDAEIIITNKVVLDAGILQQLKALRLICVTATGTNNVDLQYCAKHGITVCNVRDYATASVVQHVFTLILALTTRLGDYRAAVAAGDWTRSSQFCLLDFPITELAGKTLGIIGYGVLGRAVAEIAEAFGLKMLVAQRPGSKLCPEGRVPLHELYTHADIISLHCPLAENTQGLISAEVLRQMQDHALLINTARGGLVDEPALALALREGHIGGAGLDVLSQEPPPTDHPLLAADIPNLLITPHIAWASRESRQRLLDQVGDNIIAYLNGQPQNVVTP
jgi:glycerate dehydrogenase